MPSGFSVSLDGLSDLISQMQNVDVHEAYGSAATDTAEIATGSIQSYAQRAGVPDDVVDRIGPTIDSRNVIGVTSTHPDHDRYEYGDLDTQPAGYWRQAMIENEEYEPHFAQLLAAHMGIRQ